MPEHTIAVESGLTPVRNELRRRGYRVVELTPQGLPTADVVVITGGDDNFMGTQHIDTRAPVIIAEGRTTEEIVRAIEDKLNLQR